MKRRILAAIMAIAVAASMTACSSGDSASQSSADNTAAEGEAAEADAAAEETSDNTGIRKERSCFLQRQLPTMNSSGSWLRNVRKWWRQPGILLN